MTMGSARSSYEDLPSIEGQDDDNDAEYGGTNSFLESHNGDSSDGQDEDEVVESPLLTGRSMTSQSLRGSNGSVLYVWFVAMLFSGIIAFGLFLYRKSDLSQASDGPSAKTGGPPIPPVSSTPARVIHSNPAVASEPWNPLDIESWKDDNPLSPPSLPSWGTTDETGLGYLQQPDYQNGLLAFISEGDIYLTNVGANNSTKPSPAMKLTTTVGNVNHPKINPVYPYLIAYTATYTVRRDVYLLDLRRPGKAAMRLTYWDNSYGVRQVVGWKNDGKTLVFSATSNAVSLPDVRLYELTLQQPQDAVQQVFQVEPVPLAQAIEGAWDEDCIYFTRYQQSSRTVRYVGGTAESLWAYCDGEEEAIALTSDFNGTSKTPTIFVEGESKYLLFMSDRTWMETTNDWKATSMNLWAMELPTKAMLYGSGSKANTPIQLTSVSCEFDGRALQEYAIDGASGNAILRIGADFFSISASDIRRKLSDNSAKVQMKSMPVAVYSDFHEQQERLITAKLTKHLSAADVFETASDTTAVLLTVRGQLWVTPVLEDMDTVSTYGGGGQNMPPRRYRVVPGTRTGGSLRVLKSFVLPHFQDVSTPLTNRRLALVLATDPFSETEEHAFYILEIQSDALPAFVEYVDQAEHMPRPFLGGHLGGGSTAAGGLGSVRNVAVSPCGRRVAWTDTDGRICVATIPDYDEYKNSTNLVEYTELPKANELDEPLYGIDASLSWSPGGRYLAVNHYAKNQFQIISIADCGTPEEGKVNIGRIVQATSSRFNSMEMYWGKSTVDIFLNAEFSKLASILGVPEPEDQATTLYFLSDRDVMTDVASPWGSRAPSPHFPYQVNLYALPLQPNKDGGAGSEDAMFGRFSGGGAMEIFEKDILALENDINLVMSGSGSSEDVESRRKVEEDTWSKRRINEISRNLAIALRRGRLSRRERDFMSRQLQTMSPQADSNISSVFPIDMDIDFGPVDLTFARTAYRVAQIPAGNYYSILCQTNDDGSFVLIELNDDSYDIKIFSVDSFPSDAIEAIPVNIPAPLVKWGLSTDREYVFLLVGLKGAIKVIKNSAVKLSAFLADAAGGFTANLADTDGLTLSVWPALEYRQMYNDAWRLLRDYFYDKDMHGVDWSKVRVRYDSLVQRCSKREELDDVLAQMASELSALHVFVYGGEYSAPLEGLTELSKAHEPASLGVGLKRFPQWKGYMITEIPRRDPDFNLLDGDAVYCPLTDQTLRPTGQKGLEEGDVIVAINGESVMSVPDINMLLRGMAGRSVRLEVLRLQSGEKGNESMAELEPLVVVPIAADASSSLRYSAWEWQTRKAAKTLAAKAGFTVGYIHMRSMGADDEDAFARDFYPDYNKDALILDVRHNMGGNIDSWILTALQRKAWMYWSGRTGYGHGDIDWDEQFAFRGRIVVLIDEHTSSDGEGVSRGLSELGLAKLIGTRTWGGGIWLSSDNRLVDGGIASAPEIGTFNAKFGWGMGIEQQGVVPDVIVDNNPRTAFDGRDTQLERAIEELEKLLKEKPVSQPKMPDRRPNKALHGEDCPA